MSLTDVARGEIQVPPDQRPGHGAGALTAGLRALFAALSGLLLTCGIGVVLWAVTPSSAGGPQQSLRAAVAAFAAGNAMTLTIGRAALTLPPLMITAVAVGLLAGIGSRGGAGTDDRTGELTRTAAAAAVYATVVTTTGVVLGTPGAVAAEQWWRPFLLALVVVGAAVFLRGRASRKLVVARTPSWFPVAVRLGAVGAVGVLAAGAVAVVIGLAGSFGNAGTVQTLAAPGPAAGFGMVILGIAYLPNAVLAGAGYATGVGFHLGAGTYSPFGSSPVELPAVSLLAAVPDGHQASRFGMALLLIPVVVGLLVGRAATRRLRSRRERLLAVGVGAGFAGIALVVLAAVAGGGVTGGQWATTGAPPLLLGTVSTIVLGVFGAAVAGAARPTALGSAADATADPDATLSDAAQESGPDAADGAEAVAAAAPDDREVDVETEPAVGGTGMGETAAAETVVDETAGGETTVAAETVAAETVPGETAAAETVPDETVPAQTVADETVVAETVVDETASGEATVGAETVAAETVPTETVPQARREEDVLADADGPSDAELVDRLRRPERPQRRLTAG